ncbi:MAG: TonB-dependent receptor [Saprospiraceae bacterium]|nr:TonB-dependent receptor [Saprospiraceae bacterium]
MTKFIQYILLLFFSVHVGFLFSQKCVLSGYISDIRNGEKLIGVNIYIPELEIGTVTNNFGFYSLTVPISQEVEVFYSYIGYNTVNKKLNLTSDLKLNIDLDPEIELEVIEITAERSKKIERETQMSVAEIPIQQIKKVPALLGEVDVLRVLQLLPGVQSGGEGQSGFYVRGGSPDQNLILLDGVPVYNASHLFGFFSVFNSDAIKDVKLIKGGFPARYGGRLSSVLEINMKEGNNNEFHGNVGIGLIASKFTLEGPISKGKTSFLVSGRRTYIDVLAQPFIRSEFQNSGSEGSTGYYFYDLNGKINHRFSDKDKLYLSVYTGKDKFYFDEKDISGTIRDFTDTGLGWGNLTTALRWNHEVNNKMFANTTLTYSKYKLDTRVKTGTEYTQSKDLDQIGIEYFSGIEDVAFKIDFDYLPKPNHFVKFGISSIYHKFEPGLFLLNQVNTFDNYNFNLEVGQENIYATEFATYIEDDISITRNTKLNAGLHLSGFAVDNKFYTSLQPRLSLNQVLPNEIGLKASFATMRQYINLLAFEGIGLPTDLWLPTTARIKPQDSWQVALGAAKSFDDFEISVETYYKKMKNLIAYKDGEGLFELSDWQDRVTQGDGDAYGFELFIQKKKGRFNGWIGYTLSWTTRQFAEINDGKKFPFRYDRRHDISLVGMYDISKKVNVAATWVYGTGNAATLANSSFQGPNGTIETFGARNSYRMNPYHRLDIGINFVKKREKYTRTWSFGAYNTYANNNPFFVYFDNDYDDNTGVSTKRLKQVSLFPLIPYINYSIDF